MEELKENKNESSSIVKDSDESSEEPAISAEHKLTQAEEFLAKYKEIERRNKSKQEQLWLKKSCQVFQK